MPLSATTNGIGSTIVRLPIQAFWAEFASRAMLTRDINSSPSLPCSPWPSPGLQRPFERKPRVSLKDESLGCKPDPQSRPALHALPL
jgi:hypothetical protein